MKTILALCGVAALAACSSPEPEEQAEAEPAETAAPSEMAGSYEVALEDGTVLSSFLAEDGTFIESVGGEVTSSGNWTDEDGKICFEPSGDQPAMCYTVGDIADDGTFTATPDQGDPITVKKVD